ncbi:MAG TPA: bifunctional phosphoribosylaminoimidazolecarboxamide formyltransferase/IMP cyclohydrolase [Phycisphaerales bacterium]|jgi:phosphoribosylaminoimidazolecarboxamide formyltransferase/IMP cyclohydrolase|nr:bifunctional phosphoribosylaminoimidazolecarboxamide formyltransferase/IMP cyclohydrolase [Phycisphaerales bacterium]
MPSIRRALLSVSDKSDLVPFARALVSRGVTIISTGGTAKALSAAGVPVTPVESITSFPEGLDGRVKTLHPGVHAALLALRDHPEHQAFLRQHNIEPIELVCINLYPFQQTVADPSVSLETAIENIDVGGPAMLRGAAKNYTSVTVVTSPTHYDRVIQEMDGGAARGEPNSTTLETRAELAAAAFARTAEYDAAIASYLSRRAPTVFPQVLELRYTKLDQLRYGENPHQEAALYRDPASTGQTVPGAQQLHGKQLSYNNILDASSALEAVKALARTTGNGGASAVVVKHTNPCGGAVAGSVRDAVSLALAGDPVAAYGGILAVSAPIDRAAAAVIADEKNFLEVIIAPRFEDDALAMLRERWTSVRLLAVGDRQPSATRKVDYRSIPGGMLVQDRDSAVGGTAGASAWAAWQHRAGPAPSQEQLRAAVVLETLCRFVTSNAIVIGGADRGGLRLFGVGSGQVDRVSACRLAAVKAGERASGAVACGDAFFPFPDGPRVLVDAGVKMIVHPGGSKRDQETFDLCEQHGVTCMTTGVRHFRH